MANEYARNIKDAALIVSKVLPAAGANNNTATIDLGSVPPSNAAEGIEIEILTPAMSAYTDSTKSVTVSVQDSADNSSFADLSASLAGKASLTYTIPGVASTGTVENKTRMRLPSNCRRYIQINRSMTAGGADVTAISQTVSVLF